MTSQNHRKRLKIDLETIALGVDAHRFDEDRFLSLMRVLREKLRVSIERGSVTPLMHFTYENFERSSAQIFVGDLACRKGCSHCCNIWTDAYAPEILFVAKQLPRSDISNPSSLIAMTGEFSSKISFDQRNAMPIPCPLLVENMCSVYHIRPLNCRTAVSLDEEACRKAFIESEDVEIPVAPGWRNLGQAYSMALKGALHHAGLACQPHEWNAALKQAVEDPDLEKRWLKGEDVFTDAPVAAPVVPFTHPFWRSLYNRAFVD